MLKFKWMFFLVLVSAATTLNAQQLITRFAVVDMPRVHMAFFPESQEVRAFEQRVASVQADLNRMQVEIQQLRSRAADATMSGNQSEVLRLEADINRRSDLLREFHATRTAELESERRRLAQPGTFLTQVQDEIRFIAEREGISMVLNLDEYRGIVWLSPTVDITDRLIQSLRARR
ncbi:MAG: OmpH family outer membrane protein [Spirochaetes bacterium]|nr:OmpH family outer membrane protein [Spirochaetota bacterium]